MTEFIILGAIIALAVQLMVSLQFDNIAEQKGYKSWVYFWYCLFFPVAGWAMVIALPDLHARPSAQSAAPADSGKTAEVVSDELPDL